MGSEIGQRLLRPVVPLDVVAAEDGVLLIAGEDVRFHVGEAGDAPWISALLSALDGRRSASEASSGLDGDRAHAAISLLERLYAERLLIDEHAERASRSASLSWSIEGEGPLAARIADVCADVPSAAGGRRCAILVQRDLAHAHARDAGLRARMRDDALMWVSTGPRQRAFVSPLVLPDAGPCLSCVLEGFRRISPAPEVQIAVDEHVRRGGPLAQDDLPPQALGTLAALVGWKLSVATHPAPPPALYRLHVLEVAELSVSAWPVLRDPLCERCGAPWS